MISRWCHDDVMMMSWWFHDDFMMISWWFHDVMMMSWWCYDVMMMSWWCHDDVMMMSWWCHDDVMVMSWWFHDDFMMSLWCHYDVMMLWCHNDFMMSWWVHDVMMISWYHDDFMIPFCLLHQFLQCSYQIFSALIRFQCSNHNCMTLSLLLCDLNYWKLLFEFSLCIQQFSLNRSFCSDPITFAVIYSHLHDSNHSCMTLSLPLCGLKYWKLLY